MAEAISGFPQGSVIGPILSVTYVNDLPDHMSADSLLSSAAYTAEKLSV